MTAPWEFELGPDALLWRNGMRSGRAPYRDVRRVRLIYRPQTLQIRRFVAEIWPAGGPKLTIASSSWSGMVQQEQHDSHYSAFIAELHRRLAQAHAPTSFEAGNPAFIYWPGVAVFVAILLGLAVLTAHELLSAYWEAAAVTVAFSALFLWQSAGIFLRNRPSRYDPDALPRNVLP